MSKEIEIIKRYSEAFHARDREAARRTLHAKFYFKGPLMEMRGPDEVIQFMENMPFECNEGNVRYLQDGAVVVKIFDMTITKPFQTTVAMCEILTLEDGKIRESELFYDTAKFPKMDMGQAAHDALRA